MRFSSVFTLEMRRTFPFLVLALVALSLSLIIVQVPSGYYNVVGIVESNPFYVEVAGYVFDFHGEGIPVQVNFSVGGLYKVVNSSNGVFELTIQISNGSANEIKIIITPLEKKNLLSSFLHLTENETFLIHVKGEYSTFCSASDAYSSFNNGTFSMITVKGETVVASPPAEVKVNGVYREINSSLSVIPSQDVSPIKGVPIQYGASVLIGKNINVVLATLGIDMATIAIGSYLILSPLIRRQMDLVMRLVGVNPVFVSKLISSFVMSTSITLPSLIVLYLVDGIPLVYTISLLIPTIAFSLSLCGLSSFMGTKEMLYVSTIIGGYLLDISFYRIEEISLLTLALTLAGWIRLKRRFQ